MMSESETPPESAPPPALGDKTAALILSMFQDFYRQEVAAEEDIHRTLPFFAAALGLIIVELNQSLTQLPDWSGMVKACGLPPGTGLSTDLIGCDWPPILAGALFGLAVASGIVVLAFLFLATRIRNYQRIGPEEAQLARAKELHAFHYSEGADGDGLDVLVSGHFREQLLVAYSQAIGANRRTSASRYRARAFAVLFLILSLCAAILATILLVMSAKFGLGVKVP